MSPLAQIAAGLAVAVASIALMASTEDMPGHWIRWVAVATLTIGFVIVMAADFRKST